MCLFPLVSRGFPLVPDLQGCSNDEKQVCHGEVCHMQEEALWELLAKEHNVRLDDSSADRTVRDLVCHDVPLKQEHPTPLVTGQCIPAQGTVRTTTYSHSDIQPQVWSPPIKPLGPEGKITGLQQVLLLVLIYVSMPNCDHSP